MQSGNRHSKSERCFTPKIPLGVDSAPLSQNNNSSKELANLTRHRQMAFAPDIDIAQGLINEIRKLQLTIQEKDRLIMDLEITSADKEKYHEQTHKHLRQKTCLEEKLKEDNWNLEVANQDLQANVLDLNQTISKLNSDLNKTLQQLQTSLDHADSLKMQQEKTTAAMNAMKLKHDHEQQLLRRNNGTLHRDITQLKKRLDDANTDLKISKAKLATINNGFDRQHNPGNDNTTPSSNDTIYGNHPDSITLKSSSIGSNSTNISSNLQHSLEIETLKQSLGHAHRMVSSLRSSLQKEKVEKIELKRLLLDTQETMEQLQLATANQHYINKEGTRKPSKKNSGVKRNKVARKQGRSTKKGEIEKPMDDDQLDSLAVKTSLVSKQVGNDTGIVLLDSCDLFSGDGSMSMDDTSSLYSNDDCNSAHRLDISPIEQGKSVDMDFDLCTLGGPFKPLSSELQDSFNKRQYLDKGVNTHNDFGNMKLLEQYQSTVIDSGIKASERTANDNNDTWKSDQSSDYSKNDVEQDQVCQPSFISTISLQNASLDYILTSHNKQQEDMETTISRTYHQSNSIHDKAVDHLDMHSHDTSQLVSVPSLTSNNKESIHFRNTAPITDYKRTITSHIIDEISPIPSTHSPLTGVDDSSIPHAPIPAIENAAHHPNTPSSDQKNTSSSTLPIPLVTKSDDPWKSEPPETDRLLDSAVKEDYSSGDQPMTIMDNDQTLPVVVPRGGSQESPSLIKEYKALGLGGMTGSAPWGKDMDRKDTIHRDTSKQRSTDNYATERPAGTCSTLDIINTEESTGDKVFQETSGCLDKGTATKTQDTDMGEKELKKSDSLCGDTYAPSDKISRDEVDALVKAGVADESTKERPNTSDQEHQLCVNTTSMAEAKATTEERNNTSTIFRKDEGNIMARNSVEEILPKAYNKNQTAIICTATTTPTKSLLLTKASKASRQSSTLISRGTPKHAPQTTVTPSPISSTTSTATAAPTSSRFGILSGLMKLQPSISTPVKTGRPRPTPSTSSLRKLVASASTLPQHPRQASTLGAHKRNSRQNPATHHNDLDRHLKPPNSTPSFGTVRITEMSMYSKATSQTSLRTQKQHQVSKEQAMQSTYSSTLNQRSSSLDLSQTYDSPSNDELVLAITQTMIGEWMWKHTRRHVGSGISENKHKRFFWVHPYTRTLYWGNSEPGIGADEAKAKSALIERVSSIPSHDTMGASPLSLLIKTGRRDLKLTAPTLERHELWRMSLSYLLVPPVNMSTMGDLVQVNPYHDADTMTLPAAKGSTQTLPSANANIPGETDDEQVQCKDIRSLSPNAGGGDDHVLNTSTAASNDCE